jgi:hypothetical protein
MLLKWTRQKPERPGWYWMLSPDHHSNLPAVIQIVSEGQIGGCLALIPACQDPKHPSREIHLQHLDALWAGPVEVPSVLPKESSDMAYDRIDHPVVVS